MTTVRLQLKENLLFRYGGEGWCRHGLVRVFRGRDGLIAADTYWGSGYPSNPIDLDELASKGTLIADLDDFRDVHSDEYWRFAESDRVHIPIGGGSERWMVRTSASPDNVNALMQISAELSRWEAKKQSAEWHISDLLKEQQKYVAKSEAGQ